jgi:hypothetical protein
MSLLLRLSLLLLALLPAAACTRAGGACSGSGYRCEDPESALECRDGGWTVLACPGPSGCVVGQAELPCSSGDGGTCVGAAVACDMTGITAGEACATSANGRGLCSADGKSLLECRDGTVLRTRACDQCSVTGSEVQCLCAVDGGLAPCLR